MDKLYRIEQAAQILGVSTSTLRRWELKEKLFLIEQKVRIVYIDFPNLRCQRGKPLNVNAKPLLMPVFPAVIKNLIWNVKKKVLEMYCATHGWKVELITDLGSGMNYYKKGLKKLLNAILESNVGRLVITHKDRLLRFGAELIFALCEAKEVEVIIINSGIETKFDEELAKDVLEIITVFSARLYGSRSRKNQKLLEGMKQVVEDVARA